MGVTCQILIKKPKEGVHKPGSPVTGIVKYELDKPTEYKGIILSLVGKGRCSWSETHSSGDDKKSVTYTGTEEYISAHLNLLTKKTKGSDTVIVDVGSYKHPFEFILPNEIPPTFKDYTCSIIYELVLKFERPGFFNSKKEINAPIPISSYVEPTEPDVPIIFGLEKSLFKLFSKKRHVKLKAQISKASLVPGGNAELSFVVTNDTDDNIPSIKSELMSYTTYTANCGKKYRTQSTIAESIVESPSIPKNAVANLSSSIPISQELCSIQYSKIIHREYKLKVTVRLPMPHVNPSVEMPVLITERRLHDEATGGEDDDQPPSYWEAICEDKISDI